ncbi:hypothetical protein ACMFMG_007999 [Clarireedia jacksonii]
MTFNPQSSNFPWPSHIGSPPGPPTLKLSEYHLPKLFRSSNTCTRIVENPPAPAYGDIRALREKYAADSLASIPAFQSSTDNLGTLTHLPWNGEMNNEPWELDGRRCEYDMVKRYAGVRSGISEFSFRSVDDEFRYVVEEDARIPTYYHEILSPQTWDRQPRINSFSEYADVLYDSAIFAASHRLHDLPFETEVEERYRYQHAESLYYANPTQLYSHPTPPSLLNLYELIPFPTEFRHPNSPAPLPPPLPHPHLPQQESSFTQNMHRAQQATFALWGGIYGNPDSDEERHLWERDANKEDKEKGFGRGGGEGGRVGYEHRCGDWKGKGRGGVGDMMCDLADLQRENDGARRSGRIGKGGDRGRNE